MKNVVIENKIQEDQIDVDQSKKVQGITGQDATQEREPKLYVDVNVANFGLQRIVVYEGDTVESLVSDFVQKCPIDDAMIEKLKTLLKQQMDGVLERIDEDEEQKTDLSAEDGFDANGQLSSANRNKIGSEGAGKTSSSGKKL